MERVRALGNESRRCVDFIRFACFFFYKSTRVLRVTKLRVCSLPTLAVACRISARACLCFVGFYG